MGIKVVKMFPDWIAVNQNAWPFNFPKYIFFDSKVITGSECRCADIAIHVLKPMLKCIAATQEEFLSRFIII